MYAVGRLIGRSICTVSGPFTPFSGAVDIVVVEQPDGSFKSSPWYVRFGKFQGVLKTREKVVNICVNGVEMDFHMYLDHTGEAYFLEEVEEIVLDTSCVNELNKQSELAKSLSCDVDADGSLLARSESESSATSVTGSKRSRLLGFVWGRKLSQGESSHEINRVTSLDRAEIVADLLDVNWSTELATEKTKPRISSQLSECTASNDECDANEDIQAVTNVASLSAGDSFVQEPFTIVAQVSENFVELQSGYAGGNEQRQEAFNLNSVADVLETDSLHKLTSDSVEDFVETPQVRQRDGSILDSEIELKESDERYYGQQSSGVSSSAVDDIMHCKQTATIEGSHGNVSVEDVGLKKCAIMSASLDFILQSEIDQRIIAEGHEDEQFIFSDDELKPDEDRKTSLSASSSVEKEMDTLTSVDRKHLTLSHTSFMKAGHHEDAQKNFEDLLEREQEKTFFPIDINEFHDANTDFSERIVESLPNLWSHIDSLEADHHPRHSFDASTTSPRWLNQRGNILSLNKPDANIEDELDMSQLTVTVDDPSPKQTPKPDSVSSGVGDPSKTIVVPGGTWRLWPFTFQRTTSRSTAPSVKVADSVDVCHPTNIISETYCTKPEVKYKVIKKKMRTITPTSPQLASLGLKDGGNSITLTFSTAMLGKQQVNARIYLWKWNSRIVISDVDGTITRSDVLGQFMPMVGYDWNHIGVAPLFSAIKENGYQLLFLSARSISQSHLTRQFLFNLKQNGKSLPDGPVVISPDGLFPSLFREVIRRAPHEFKIACLEDIKALFPPDVSPFYAGFGNRDTDEISYLRIGIPENKIFIINPKGEVAIHRRVGTNSYSDLHSLVDGMFPVVSSSEPEAFNSFNFWKLPPRLDYEI